MEAKSSTSLLNWSNLKRNEGQVQLPKFNTSGRLPATEGAIRGYNLHTVVFLHVASSLLHANLSLLSLWDESWA